MRCGECGNRKFKLINIKGTFHPWKDYSRVELLNDQEVLACDVCGNQIFDSAALEALDLNIVESIKMKVSSAIRYFTERLKISQEDLAEALGVTPEYLSTVKTGKKRLSFTAFNLLMSYQKHPQLLSELAGITVLALYQASFPFAKGILASALGEAIPGSIDSQVHGSGSVQAHFSGEWIGGTAVVWTKAAPAGTVSPVVVNAYHEAEPTPIQTDYQTLLKAAGGLR